MDNIDDKLNTLQEFSLQQCNNLNAILTCLQTLNEQVELLKNRDVPVELKKPDFIPFQSKDDLLKYDEASDDDEIDLINYLNHLRGRDMKEMIRLMLDVTLTDEICQEYILLGTNTKSQLSSTRLVSNIRGKNLFYFI
ncbi:uncharacterized protein LOC103573406 [Microplitis demolitor]|uniref:uncharacterized protein LOC103573406 n=1 Tax=Microplitis demolitor TaxID=69319 RepID=UPI0004CC9F01|nr:uncharacterized protein LOC103573406 [Microplitis demolitor]